MTAFVRTPEIYTFAGVHRVLTALDLYAYVRLEIAAYLAWNPLPPESAQ